MYTNSEILSAVIIRWGQPLINAILVNNNKFPFLGNIETKIKSTGWVSQGWSITNEMSPIMSKVGGKILAPFITSLLGDIADKDIPMVAHSICDASIENGGMTLFDGNVRFSRSDMEELKRYLNANLPFKSTESGYIVKEV